MNKNVFLKVLAGGVVALCAGVLMTSCSSDVNFAVSTACEHVEVADARVEATCTENGKTAGSHCGICGQTLDVQELVPATGHSFTEATCEKAKTCTVCGVSEGLPEGHNWKEATCKDPKTCSRCSLTEGTTTGHEYDGENCRHCGQRKPSEGLSYALTEDEQGYAVTGIGSCTDSIVVVPEVYEGKPVTGIVTLSSSKITEVHLPKSIHLIGNRAFEGCSALVRISLSEGLASVGTYAFNNCVSLESIELPATTLSVGGWAFNGCTSLKSAHFPDSIVTLGKSVFAECSALVSLQMPAHVSLIDKYVLYHCTSLETINFSGTMAEWEALPKESSWNLSTGAYVIKCSDGNIEK